MQHISKHCQLDLCKHNLPVMRIVNKWLNAWRTCYELCHAIMQWPHKIRIACRMERNVNERKRILIVCKGILYRDFFPLISGSLALFSSHQRTFKSLAIYFSGKLVYFFAYHFMFLLLKKHGTEFNQNHSFWIFLFIFSFFFFFIRISVLTSFLEQKYSIFIYRIRLLNVAYILIRA